MRLAIIGQLLYLLTLANGAPVIAKKVLGDRLAWPLDAGVRLSDGQPLFGPSKTLRGLVVSVVASALGAPLVGLDLAVGVAIAGGAMAGDLFSSFVKRRLKRAPSSQLTGLDQIPEALLPLLICAGALSLSAAEMAATVAIFFVGEILASRLLFKLKIRDRPY